MSRRLGRTLGEAGIHVPKLLIQYKEMEVVLDI